MTGLDTNVLVRYIMQDDPAQCRKASLLIESLTAQNPAFISMIVVIELYWVLTESYDLRKDQAADAIDALLQFQEIQVERAEQVRQALRLHRIKSSDFADCLILQISKNAGCESVATFDLKAAKNIGMTLIR